jgi:hypothetical protein
MSKARILAGGLLVAMMFPMVLALFGCKAVQPKSVLSGGETQTQPPAQATRIIKPLTLVPPESDGTAQEALAALRKAGDEYKGFTVSGAGTQIELSDISIAVEIQKKSYEMPVTEGALRGMASKPLNQKQQDSMAQTIVQSTSLYLSKLLRVSAAARFRILIFAPESEMEETDFDSHGKPYGVMNLELFFLDTRAKAVLWHNNRARGVGNDPESLADYAARSINPQLGTLLLLGEKKPQN